LLYNRGLNINLAKVAALEPTCMENLKELLFIESFLRVLASLAPPPSDCISLQQRIGYTAT